MATTQRGAVPAHTPIDLATLGATFAERGYVILPGFFESEVVASARAGCEWLVERDAQRLRAEGKIAELFAAAPFETRVARIYERNLDLAPKVYRRELHREAFFPIFFHPRLLDVVEALLGGEIRLYPNYSVRPKLPDWEGTLVLWHQDGGYTESGMHGGGGGDVAALRMVNVWSPLVPARVANGCMQFIPGTHTLGSLPHVRRTHYLEIVEEALRPHLGAAVNIELDPGDVVLFNNMLLHQGLPNTTNTVRWSLDWRYQDATQATLRDTQGHIARSRSNPSSAVQSAADWARLTFR
ncbi:MAG: phytanoyl-CoA dioxygenase family protein [Actinobacteria bacterium]|nr:phytanoyl-CoA dioxygenase family protein [Actinomycetota bacterium]